MKKPIIFNAVSTTHYAKNYPEQSSIMADWRQEDWATQGVV